MIRWILATVWYLTGGVSDKTGVPLGLNMLVDRLMREERSRVGGRHPRRDRYLVASVQPHQAPK